MSTLKDRFRELRLKKGFSQEKLAEIIGVTQAAITALENGKIINPRDIYKYAEVLDTTVEWLMEGKNISTYKVVDHGGVVNNVPNGIVYIPIVDWDEIDLPFEIRADRQFIPICADVNDSFYALIIKGDSMISNNQSKHSFNQGDIIAIDGLAEPSSGDFVIALLDNGEAIVRQFMIDGSKIFLKANDTSYPTIAVSNNIKIKGVVSSVMTSFKKK